MAGVTKAMGETGGFGGGTSQHPFGGQLPSSTFSMATPTPLQAQQQPLGSLGWNAQTGFANPANLGATQPPQNPNYLAPGQNPHGVGATNPYNVPNMTFHGNAGQPAIDAINANLVKQTGDNVPIVGQGNAWWQDPAWNRDGQGGWFNTETGQTYNQLTGEQTSPDDGAINPGGGGTGIGSDDGSQWVGTSVVPEPVYTSQDTQHAINQAAQQYWAGSDMNNSMKPYTRPGVSRDAGTQALATPRMVDAASNVGMASQMIPIQHEFANNASMASGQQNLASEFMALANIKRQQQQAQDYQNQSVLQPLMWQTMFG